MRSARQNELFVPMHPKASSVVHLLGHQEQSAFNTSALSSRTTLTYKQDICLKTLFFFWGGGSIYIYIYVQLKIRPASPTIQFIDSINRHRNSSIYIEEDIVHHIRVSPTLHVWTILPLCWFSGVARVTGFPRGILAVRTTQFCFMFCTFLYRGGCPFSSTTSAVKKVTI